MSDQTTLFESSYDNIIKAQIDNLCSLLENKLLDNYLDRTFLHVKRTAGYWSLLFENSVVVRVYSKPLKISCKKSVISQFPEYQIYMDNNDKNKDPYVKIPLNNPSEIKSHTALIAAALQTTIDNYPKEWDCCHRYEECSDAKRCTHPDKHEGIKCGYRKALATGKIYYGKNCTIKDHKTTKVV